SAEKESTRKTHIRTRYVFCPGSTFILFCRVLWEKKQNSTSDRDSWQTGQQQDVIVGGNRAVVYTKQVKTFSGG
ncbi:hypothetical protein DVA76_19655, partial [Acinetobacter baumannii]